MSPRNVFLYCLFAAWLASPLHAQRATDGPAQSPPTSTNAGLIAQSLPRVSYHGGPYLRRPRVVTVTFKGDDARLVARLEKFGSRITSTRWWSEVTAGYCANAGECIGAGRPGGGVRLDEVLPEKVYDVDVEALLTREALSRRLGNFDTDTILLVYLPTAVRLSDAFNPQYCGDGPRAYHRALKLGESKLAYAVLPRCGDEAELTATASHEILEATTNPDPSNRGFAFVRNSGTAGFTAAGVEPVDPCAVLAMGDRTRLEAGFVVQRAWSNRAASLGGDPCVPAERDVPYLAMIPRQPTVRLSSGGERSKILLEAAADRTVGPWEISARDLAELQGKPACVKVSLDRQQVRPYQTATLSIELRNRRPAQMCVVALFSRLDGNTNVWPLAVVVL